jgi:tRNA-dihydrouridine synthase
VTDTTFRRLCRENGADIVVTEMVSAKGLLCDPVRSGRYLAYDEAERPVGAQLFGSVPGEIAEAAAEVARRGFDFVDINMGCPVRKVTGGGSGAAILSKPRLAGEIARAAVRAAGIPVTAKIRSGFGTEKETYLAVAEELFAAPEPPPVTFRTGHPMLMSTKSNPRRATSAAASPISPGSEPNSWAPTGRSASS